MENNWFLYASLAGLLIGINTVMNNYFMNKNINPYIMLILKALFFLFFALIITLIQSQNGNITLKECIELDNISLYYFPRKKLQKPIEAGISAPTSGYGKTDNPEWKDDGFYFFEINGKYLEVPTKYKKLLELKIFDEEKLKAFRKKYKLDLRKEGKLIELVKYFNEN